MASASPSYPPRSRWYSPFRHGWYALTRRIPSARSLVVELDFPLGLRDTLWSLLIPGFAFRALGHRLIGKIAMIGCGLGWLVFFIALGSYAANIAFALILSLHATSVSFLLVRMCPGMRFTLRILSTFCVLLVMVSVYGFIQGRLGKIFIPLRIGADVVVVRATAPGNLRRGEWVARHIGGSSRSFQTRIDHGAIRIPDGYSLDRILACPGDVVRFHVENFQVNDQFFPRMARMPARGEWVVPKKHWFAWPQFTVHNSGVHETEISNVMLAHAVISEDQFVGKPFRRWFGRRQILP